MRFMPILSLGLIATMGWGAPLLSAAQSQGLQQPLPQQPWTVHVDVSERIRTYDPVMLALSTMVPSPCFDVMYSVERESPFEFIVIPMVFPIDNFCGGGSQVRSSKISLGKLPTGFYHLTIEGTYQNEVPFVFEVVEAGG